MAEYRIEVYNKAGVNLGNIRPLASNLKWSEQRNAAETVSFSMDLQKYEEYVARVGMTPYDFMDAGTTDIRLVRNGVERIGAHLVKFEYSPDDPGVSVELAFSGYLNYFKDAYVDVSQKNVDQGDILWNVINQYQSKPHANFGITKGTNVSRGMKRERNQKLAEVKDFIVRMTNVIAGPDIQFTPNKEFHSYDVMGTYRPDVRLIYPGNVDSFGFERSVATLANYIYAIGSGNGEDAVNTTSQDVPSMIERYRREKVVTFNSVEQEATLQQNADGVKEVAKLVYELPQFTVHDGILDVGVVRAGDTLYAEIGGYKSFEHVHGDYRLEKLEVDVDDNDSETVTVTFDDINIDDIIEQQDTEDA